MKNLAAILFELLLVLNLTCCKKQDNANCFDGIKNQTETGVDCGGPCTSCLSFIDSIAGSYIVSGTYNTWSGFSGNSTPIVPDSMRVYKVNDSVLYIVFRTWEGNFKYGHSLGDSILYSFSTAGMSSGTDHDYASFFKGKDSVTAALYWGGGVNGGGYYLDGHKIH